MEGNKRAGVLMDMEGIALLALLPSGSLSGHFLHPPSSKCLGLFGTEIACERECSRGEDYRLLNLTILDFTTKKETTVVVERRGQDAARLSNACDVHGWEEEVVREAGKCSGAKEQQPVVFFECETLKADCEAEEHIKRFLPSLVGCDAIVNIGPMTIKGLSLDANDRAETPACQEDSKVQQITHQYKRGSLDSEVWQFVHKELEAEGLLAGLPQPLQQVQEDRSLSWRSSPGAISTDENENHVIEQAPAPRSASPRELERSCNVKEIWSETHECPVSEV